MVDGHWTVNPVHKKHSGFESHPSHKCRFSAYIGNCNATVISVLMVSYHNKLEIKDTMIYIIGMEVRFLRRHKYGDCSSVGRVEDCDSFGHGFDPHHSPGNKICGGSSVGRARA